MSLSVSGWPTYSTARVIANSVKGSSTGTAFYVNFAVDADGNSPALVTNKHVIDGANDFVIYLKVLSGGRTDIENTELFRLTFPNDNNFWVRHPDPDVDLAALPLAMFFRGAELQGKKPIYTAFGHDMIADHAYYKSLAAIENILMVGYPIGLWNSVHNNPICRRGITATPTFNDFNGKKSF